MGFARRRSSTKFLRLACGLAAIPLLLAAGPAPRPIGADGRAEYRVAELVSIGPADAAELSRLGFDVERAGDGRFIAYLTVEEMKKLDTLGIGWRELPDPGLEALAREQEAPLAPSYHTYGTLTTELQQVALDHPGIARLSSAGKSVQGRELWWLKITDNPEADENEPAFRYVSSLHGDEVVGMENCIALIHWLTDRYGSDPRVNRLVDGAEIWIMPMANPDGTTLHQRYNAQGVDLNRSFPDMYDDPVDDPAGRAVETQLLMNWQTGRSTVLSANFHGGALVVNYPYDNTPSGASYYHASPDDDTFIDISLDYSEDNLPMYNGAWPQGITNGADWYTISGGMQDWLYHWRGEMDLTVEVSNTKWPSASTLEQYWNDNRESMVSYMERALTGVRGLVTDAETGAPVRATVKIAGRDEVFFSDAAIGDYHRPIAAGTFQVEAQAPGYDTASAPFTVAAPRADAVVVNLALNPRPTALAHAGHRVALDSGGDGFLGPGETGQLAVTLSNDGRTATGVAGELVSVDPYWSSTGVVGWPDIAPGVQAESSAPHAAVQVLPTTPEGHKLAGFARWQAAGGAAGDTAVFFTPVGAPTTGDTAATDVPRSIPDAMSYTESVINIASDREITEVNARVDITHTYIGDLAVSLFAPDGTNVRLHDHTGGSADNIHTWYDTTTRPVDDLGVLAGKPSAGAWRLRVADTAGGDSGTLDGWTLQLVTRAWEDPVPEVLLARVTRVGQSAHLEWWPVGSAQTYKVHRATDPRSAAGFTDVTGSDPDPADRVFEDSEPVAPGAAAYFIVSGVGHTGEGLWGHYGR